MNPLIEPILALFTSLKHYFFVIFLLVPMKAGPLNFFSHPNFLLFLQNSQNSSCLGS